MKTEVVQRQEEKVVYATQEVNGIPFRRAHVHGHVCLGVCVCQLGFNWQED